jgi:perosamine synthetase
MNTRVIPVSTPSITASDIEAVATALSDGWVSGEGPIVDGFECSLAEFCSRNHAVSVTNGTAALELAVHSLEIGIGDEVIVPSFAIISCVAQVLRSGATPVFVDSDALTWNMNVDEIARHISPRTRAIIAVHTYGLPVDMDPLLELCSRHGISLIEDAAEAHGLTYKDRRCGSFGALSTFSFYANKNVSSGEGGAVLTDDPDLNQRLRYFRNLTFRAEERFVHHDLGWNLRMSSLQCALAHSQLSRVAETVDKRRHIGDYYRERLRNIVDIQLPAVESGQTRNDYWVFGIVLNGKRAGARASVQKDLQAAGIGTRPFFYPLHQQPVLAKFGFSIQPHLPVAEHLGSNGFYIPNGLGMSDSDVEYVADMCLRVLQ